MNNGHSYLLFFPAQPQVVVTSALRESGRLRLLVGRVVLEIVDLCATRHYERYVTLHRKVCG